MKRQPFIFLLPLFAAFTSQLYTRHATSQLALAADNHWYLESGQQLLSLNPSISQLIFSPFFSLLLYLQNYLTFESTSLLSHFFFVFLPTLFFSWGLWSLLLSLIYFLEIPRSTSAILYLLVLSNPYLIKYASPLFSDSFSLLAGLLFTLHFGTGFSACQHLPLRFTRFLQSKPAFYTTMLILAFFRYLNIILLVASLITECWPSFHRYRSQASLPRAVAKALLICFLVLLPVAAVHTFTYFFHDSSSLSAGSSLLQISHLPRAITMSVLLNLGFREGFRIALDQPGLLFNYQSLADTFSEANYAFSLPEYFGSILYALLFLIGSITAFIAIYRRDPGYTKVFFIAFLLLVLSELFLGVSHHRYFLMFVPSVIYGLGLSLKDQRA